ITYPDGDLRRYALLVFFFPTLLFWPSSIGKEAFMILALGAAALGAAQLFVGRFRGLVWLALGLWGAAVVRPHMALIVGAGLVVAAPLVVLRGGAQAKGRQRGRLAGAALVPLCVRSFRRLARLKVELPRRPYLVFGFVYTLAFIYAFSALQNFGILARERSQLLPALFVLLCIPKPVDPTSASS